MALTLVEPVFGTSTKMHLCLCEITACRIEVWEYSSCGSAGTRTRNQRLKRALLYRLSYRPLRKRFLKYIAANRKVVGHALARQPQVRQAVCLPYSFKS